MNTKELIKNKEATRFMLPDKSQNSFMKAFEMSGELNKLEVPENGKIMKWRVGITTDTQLVVDIDNHDEANFKNVLWNLKTIFPDDKFIAWNTLHGEAKHHYQIVSKEKSKADFIFKHLKVLDMKLEREYFEMRAFKNALINRLNDYRENRDKSKPWQFNNVLRESGLINPVGDIDFSYNVIAVEKERSSIRLTNKTDADRWEVIYNDH